jgi:hypothetical protein
MDVVGGFIKNNEDKSKDAHIGFFLMGYIPISILRKRMHESKKTSK